MLTIHQANGRGPRADEASCTRAARRVARLRRLDPHLVNALGEPENLYPDGRPKVLLLARALDRTVAQVRQDLEALRASAGE